VLCRLFYDTALISRCDLQISWMSVSQLALTYAVLYHRWLDLNVSSASGAKTDDAVYGSKRHGGTVLPQSVISLLVTGLFHSTEGAACDQPGSVVECSYRKRASALGDCEWRQNNGCRPWDYHVMAFSARAFVPAFIASS